ncbi:MAG: ATP-binding protein [Solibacillus sp.]|uniref:two-component system sensor histidine kinase NtrB n=1 Tax=Solibacillus sp. TaxID=1909654 RepID=UPI003314F2ED
MQQHDVLQKRNLFTLITYLCSNLVVVIAIIFQQFSHHFSFLIFCGFSVFILLALYFIKTPPKILQIILIFTWHILIFLYNFQSENPITLYGFIYLISVLAIYRSFLVNIINSVFVLLEIVLLFEFSVISLAFFKVQENYLFFFFLLIVCVVSIAQSFYIKQIWMKMEKRALAREYDLNSKQAYLGLFFEQAEDAIAVFDLEDRVITVNPSFEKLYGWTKEESIGRSLPLVPPENIEDAKKRSQLLKQGQSYQLFETTDMRKDGTIFNAQISLSPIFNPDGAVIAASVISRDISYIKENEKLVRQSEKLKLVGELAAGVAHEIRNPMTVISGFVQMMNDDQDSPYYEYTKLIQKETERVELILSEFLVLSRPQATQFVPIHLANTLDEIAQFFQYEFQHQSIEFKLNNRYQDIVILGNENQIKQVFINLFRNAMEAMPNDGTLTLDVCPSDDNKEIFIGIKDTGCGIPPYVLERIFEPFYTTKTKGTGLGMMIINKIIQDHNGSIKIRSQENIGTEILLSFPVNYR